MDQRELEDWVDSFRTRRERAKRAYHARRPKPIGKVVAQLLTAKGYGRQQSDAHLADIWANVVGESLAAVSRVGRLKRGQLEVRVASSTAVQELTFDQRRIVARLQAEMPGARIQRLHFRVGALP